MGGEFRSDRIPTYCGVRTERFLYALYATGEQELYDLEADPYQLENLARDRFCGSTRRALCSARCAGFATHCRPGFIRAPSARSEARRATTTSSARAAATSSACAVGETA